MEAVEIADLVIEPQVVLIDDTTVSLSISAQGKPEITIEKAGKNLKAIPAKLKQNPDIAALTTWSLPKNGISGNMNVSPANASNPSNKSSANFVS